MCLLPRSLIFSTSVLHPRRAADTPIEEFTPTPAFPALQYLESVDEGGVAWQAGLRTGDFLIEVRAAPFLSPGLLDLRGVKTPAVAVGVCLCPPACLHVSNLGRSFSCCTPTCEL